MIEDEQILEFAMLADDALRRRLLGRLPGRPVGWRIIGPARRLSKRGEPLALLLTGAGSRGNAPFPQSVNARVHRQKSAAGDRIGMHKRYGLT
ncbi:MAG: hypothetical protein GEU87_05555 [Alphaproteobacteria bacterium]|nr:hypothetical protein [Alphaproteobacteria bacterium]